MKHYNSFIFVLLLTAPSLLFADVSVFITEPAEGAVVAPCSDVLLKADYTATAGEVVKDITFYYNGIAKRRVRSAPWEYTWTNIAKGAYELTAKLKTSDNTEIWSEPVHFKAGAVSAGEKLYNGGFDCGTLGPLWRTVVGDGASADFIVYDDTYFDDAYYLAVEIETLGTQQWSIQMLHKCPMDSGHTYEISFLADAPEKKSIYMGMQLGQDPWTPQFSTDIEIDGADLYGPFEFTAETTDPTNDLVFHFGRDDTPLFMDDISVIDRSATSVKSKMLDLGSGLSSEYELFQAYPNPFNSSTTIAFQLSNPAIVALEIFNMQGQKIKTLSNSYRAEGRHIVKWNGENDRNEIVPSGIYVYRLDVNDGMITRVLTRKMVLVK